MFGNDKKVDPVQGTETTQTTETPETKPETTTIPEPKGGEFKPEIGDKIEFWPTGAEKPKTIVVDEAFLKTELSEEIIIKHKYKKL
ncbi:hypothetical protein [Tenacibaculum sp.]|uniref:hypothetical protein n=1 Tax=Tenacibaculum sp. TaxID=1906242 RepID=UPI003D09E3D1